MIDFCKGQGIKVFLSLGGRPDLSPDDAQKVADDIWNNFLNNSAGHGPLNATVDGIDFRIQSGSNQSLDVLAQALSAYSIPDRKVYLSAAPLCQIPDDFLTLLSKLASLTTCGCNFSMILHVNTVQKVRLPSSQVGLHGLVI
ncbi:hevamine-A-like [Coffea arabica]|uniref:Hevamine-A-like n=1 Tax=Coffea arabica TaxID=13443 RepID=A0A6P6SF45_COFAR|nr:hevamine-A-like [Coffea arabica]